jgi:heme oxygenase
MNLIERLGLSCAEHQRVTDEELFRLLGRVTPGAYKGYLMRTYGFVRPLEQSILHVPGIEHAIDTRRFAKHLLLLQDLQSSGMTYAEIERLSLCAIPVFRAPAVALGWAYPLERSTLLHGNVFRHLASAMLGHVVSSCAYLKCYNGAVGEHWSRFGDALQRSAPTEVHADLVIDSARAAFETYRTWLGAIV